MSDYAGDISVDEAWDLLRKDESAVLIDVRTDAEWAYVGLPDLTALDKEPILLPWQVFPSMEVNTGFADQLESLDLDENAPLLFLCRSGARSRAAAIAMTERGYARCFNVAGGFEGDPDENRHRGTVNGWKAADLPWVQQ